jgi:hypothetical protein
MVRSILLKALLEFVAVTTRYFRGPRERAADP